MSPPLRKAVLAAHLTCSVGWVGAAVAYVVLGYTAGASTTAETIRATWIAMELVGWYVIVPLAVTSLTTGVVMAIGTRWGLLRHYWVIFSLALTTFATAVLLLHMPSVSVNADRARKADLPELRSLGGDLLHPAFGLVVLLVALVLNIYKPRGLTTYGARKLHERRATADGVPTPSPPSSTTRRR